MNLMQNADLNKKKAWQSLLSHINMGEESLMFGNTKIEKKKTFCRNKTPVSLSIGI